VHSATVKAPGRSRGAEAFLFACEAARTATAVHARPKRCAEQLPFSRVGIGKRCAHGLDRNRRYDAREKQPQDTNPDRECPREGLTWASLAATRPAHYG